VGCPSKAVRCGRGQRWGGAEGPGPRSGHRAGMPLGVFGGGGGVASQPAAMIAANSASIHAASTLRTSSSSDASRSSANCVFPFMLTSPPTSWPGGPFGHLRSCCVHRHLRWVETGRTGSRPAHEPGTRHLRRLRGRVLVGCIADLAGRTSSLRGERAPLLGATSPQLPVSCGRSAQPRR